MREESKRDRNNSVDKKWCCYIEHFYFVKAFNLIRIIIQENWRPLKYHAFIEKVMAENLSGKKVRVNLGQSFFELKYRAIIFLGQSFFRFESIWVIFVRKLVFGLKLSHTYCCREQDKAAGSTRKSERFCRIYEAMLRFDRTNQLLDPPSTGLVPLPRRVQIRKLLTWLVRHFVPSWLRHILVVRFIFCDPLSAESSICRGQIL